ncbi:DUF7524 family protein [Halorubrum tibetense]|uniref:Uncharacterized protein n=1 Tax=Halorubrum tibetense TaxID=175631 RepID=A0ABD5S9M3_9EURY
MPTLEVELNGNGVHHIDAPDRFTTTKPFSIALANRGRSTHVHLRFDDTLDRVVTIDEVNHFVEDEGVKRIHVSKRDVDEPIRGKLQVVTGYGSNSVYVDVMIELPAEEAPDEVLVDERLSKPPERSPAQPPSQQAGAALDRLIERGGIAALLLGFLAVGLGIALAFAVDSALVFLVVGAVLTVTLAVALLLVW